MNQDDTSKDKSTWGGARPGSGRPKGSMNPASKERAAVKAAFQERVSQNADRLFNAQFNLATGEQYLMWRHKIGTGAKERLTVEIVDDPEIIKAYLDETLDIKEGEWYFISTKPANGMAIDSLLDRSFGKAEQKMDVTSDGGKLNSGVADPLVASQFAEFLKQQTKS